MGHDETWPSWQQSLPSCEAVGSSALLLVLQRPVKRLLLAVGAAWVGRSGASEGLRSIPSLASRPALLEATLTVALGCQQSAINKDAALGPAENGQEMFDVGFQETRNQMSGSAAWPTRHPVKLPPPWATACLLPICWPGVVCGKARGWRVSLGHVCGFLAGSKAGIPNQRRFHPLPPWER